MIFLIGGNGYLGQAFQRELTERFIPFKVLSRSELDYTRFEVLHLFLKEHRRSVRLVINLAGLTGVPNVDWNEYHRAQTILANVVLPETISNACLALDLPMAQLSSGCVYDAPSPPGGFTERDPANFTFATRCSFYSGSKAISEELLRNNPMVFIWRLRMPFSEVSHPKNLLAKLLAYHKIFDSPGNSLSHLGESVKACVDLWEGGAPYGIWHVTNPGTATNRQIVEMIQRILKPEREFEFYHSDAAFEAETSAPRSNCILDSRKLAAAGVKLQDVRAALQESLDNWESALP